VVAPEQDAETEVVEDYRIPYFEVLRDSLSLTTVPFTERGSRILVGLKQSTSSEGGSSEMEADGLEVRMAERWPHLEKRLGNHRVRRPLIEGLRPTNSSGHPLPYELHTWPHKILLQTSVGCFEIVFADRQTLYICFPPGKCGISFSIMADDFLPDEFGGVVEHPRRFAITSSGAPTTVRVSGQHDGRLFLAVDAQGDAQSPLAIHIPEAMDCSRTLRPVSDIIREAELAWKAWFDAAPRVSKKYWRPYYYAWMILRMGLLSPMGCLKREALAPSKTHYLGVWHWDAYFHALAYRHVDAKLAQDQLLAVLDHQTDSGMIPDVVYDEGIIVRESGPEGRELTKPPLIAWSALKLFETGSGSGFLKDIYDRLVRWNNWWLEHCDDDRDGIAQYNHPYSSGLDDSPLWDAGMPVESPDLNTYLCVQMQSLAAIARVIGRYDDADLWDREARDLAQRISSHFYDPASGVYWATKDHSPIRVLTPFNLFPIWTGCLSSQELRAAISNLTRENWLWTEFGVPTVSRGDRTYDPNRMWRGPIWVNVNYMLVEALSKAGYHSLAATLANRTTDLVASQGVAEYFNSMTGEVPDRAAPAFGWSAALFVDLLIRRSRGDLLPSRFGGYANGFSSYPSSRRQTI